MIGVKIVVLWIFVFILFRILLGRVMVGIIGGSNSSNLGVLGK